VKSIGAMVKQLQPLCGTSDLTAWETDFVENVVLRSNNGTLTTRLSEKQVEVIGRIYNKHFGDAQPA